MGDRVDPADIVFRKTGNRYRAIPPAPIVNRLSQRELLVRNLTGLPVTVWAPQGVLLGTPLDVPSKGEQIFAVNPDLEPGTYVYTAYVKDTDQFVEGNSPPAIIIDK